MMVDLDAFERFRLAHLPTPIQPLRRLSKYLEGPEIWIKRDDCTGLAGGGNKTRKLEYLVADAISSGADTLVTIGGIQSNHTRQTAAAAAVAGLRCTLVLARWVDWPNAHYEDVGNILLSRILGSEIEIIESSFLRSSNTPPRGSLVAAAERVRENGGSPYIIPGGASDHRLGGLGYVKCASEISEQMEELGLSFDYVVVASSSGSTQAGLVVGSQTLKSPPVVVGIDVKADAKGNREMVTKIAQQTANLIGLNLPSLSDAIQMEADYSGPAYGVPDDRTRRAIELMGRLEGILVDPVYEGKSMAALIDMVRRGVFNPNEKVLFLHLGGTPALHAYGDLF